MSVDSNSISAMLILMGYNKENIAEMTGVLGNNITVNNAIDFLSSLSENSTAVKSLPKRNIIDLTDDDSTDNVNLSSNNMEKSLLTSTSMSNTAVQITECKTSNTKNLKILSYNLWFNEDVAFQERMSEISNIINAEKPNFICFQEVTQNMYNLFSRRNWWSSYKCSLSPLMVSRQGPYFVMLLSDDFSVTFQSKSFQESIMGRELVFASSSKHKLIVSTSHFESPVPPNFYENERKRQLNQSINWLSNPIPSLAPSNAVGNKSSTINDTWDRILIGDLNWTEKRYGKQPGDGTMELPVDWIDAWTTLQGNAFGYTYDAKTNPMLKGYLQGRLDRCLCKLQYHQLKDIVRIGRDPIPGVTYQKPTKKRTRDMAESIVAFETLPVLPSDHYGLLVTLSRH